MPEDENHDDQNDNDEGDDQNQEPQRLPVWEVAKAGAGIARILRNTDVASTLDDIGSAADLMDPGVDTAITFLRGAGQATIADDLDARRTAVREEHDARRAEQEKADAKTRAEALKAEARAELARTREESARAAEKERARLAVLEEEAAAAAVARGEDIPDVSEQVQEIIREVDEIRKTPAPEFDRKMQALELRIGPAQKLADIVGNPRLSAAERVDAWESADPETRGLASQMFGLPGVFDLDPDSADYRKQLDAARKQAAEDESWVTQQLEQMGRS
jgi:hypothetical protein